jgi:hypothetical protein
MPIALSATVEASAGAGSLPRVRLDVTGAPAGPTPKYASNFATVDGWTTGANGTLSVAGGVATMGTTGPPTAVFSRTVTGLTIGTAYTFSVLVDPQVAGAQVQIGESVLGTYTAWTTPAGTSPFGTFYALSYTFTATATSHTIQIRTRPGVGAPYTQAFAVKDARVVATAWAGTRIVRTDANGAGVTVRGSSDYASTAYTVHDYDAALLGLVTYTATDGNGATATATTTHAPYLTNLATNPSAETAGAATERRRNLFPNPSASVNATNVGAGYGTGGAGTITRQTSGSPSALGTFFRQTWSAAPSAANGLFVANSAAGARFAVAPGDVWSASIAFRSSIATSHKLGIVYADAGNVQIGGANYGADVAVAAGAWATVTTSGTVAPAGAANAYLIAVPATGAALPVIGTTHDYTLFTAVKEATAGPGFDGDTATDGAYTFAWTGTAGASASTASASTPTTWGSGLASTRVLRDSTRSSGGAYAVRGEWLVGAALSGAVLATVATVAGKTYTFSCDVWIPAGSPPAQLTAYFVTASPSTITTTGQWVRASHTFTATAASTSVGVTNAGAVSDEGRAVWVDRLVVVEGTVAPDYFDGSTVAADPAVAAYWTGTPNASTSIQTSPKAGAGVWLTLPATVLVPNVAPPANVAVLFVTELDQSRDSNGTIHKIIGRADPLGNPGPLATREGTITLFAPDYLTAKATVDLLDAGDVALLRQPDFAGMDMHFLTRSAAIRQTAARRRWTVAVSYQEVTAP